ncbi:MAG: DUF502 domain-containing protein [Dethiobacter sp.]|nr:DUF502 domain-containing protein [Dethiobacter sp.]MBS3983031.1 DUF502 domain-containing protein [Dethiobacter sp.]MCL5993731.1 DUF502 domain-containing protein [Bacillota bacterium]
MRIVRRIFLTGLVILLPAIISIYILGFTFNWVDSLLGNLLRQYLGVRIPGLGFLITVAAIFVAGLVANNVFGNKVLKMVENGFANIPLVRPIYTATKQIIDAFSAQRKSVFESVAMIEYPRKGIYGVGFVTGSGLGEVQEKTSQDVVALFLPTTPNPTSGFLLLVPREELIPLEMSVEEALKLIISGGVIVPDWPRNSAKTEQRCVSPEIHN